MPKSIRQIPSAPNLDHDKKEAKSLRRDIADGDRAAAERVRRSHPAFTRMSVDDVLAADVGLRDAQIVIAREYGFDNWADWNSYVESGGGVFRLAARAIEKMDVERLRQLVAEHPSLVTDTDEDGGLLIGVTQSYAHNCSYDEDRWVSVPCAEVLIDAGSVVDEGTRERALETGATKMLTMFVRKGAVQLDLRIAAAVGDLAYLREHADDEVEIANALSYACRHGQEEAAAFLFEQAVARDPKLSADTLAYLHERRDAVQLETGLTLRGNVAHMRMDDAANDNDVETFLRFLDERPELLTAEHLKWQIDTLEGCAYGFKPAIARAILDAGASVKTPPRPHSPAMEYAIDCGCTEMIELLWDLWPPNDDLPTQAGLGRLDVVQSMLDETKPDAETLVRALGLAVMNEKLDVAELLLDRGADINAPWGLHERATVLHEAAGNGKMESVKLLIAKGADPNIRDQRFDGLPHDWARFNGQPEACDYIRPNAISQSLTTAAQCGTVDDVRKHVEAGADVNEPIDFDRVLGVTALMLAVYHDDPEIVEYLLACDADASRLDSDRRGPFHRIYGEHEHGVRIVEALVKAGADVTTPNNQGVTPLEHLEEQELDDVAAVLRPYTH